MATKSSSRGILAEANAEDRDEIVEMLTKAYWMEVETVISYLANSINPDGVRAQEIIESLKEDIEEELGHARKYGERIKDLYGVVPGSLEFSAEQSYLQPPEQQTDIVHVIKGVIEAETGAIDFYNEIIERTEEVDPVTNDMVIAILRDEEGRGQGLGNVAAGADSPSAGLTDRQPPRTGGQEMPPRGVKPGTKRARQYEHIRQSEKDQGASESRAEEIAARTVNKEKARAGESRTRSRSSTNDISSSRRGGLRSGTNRPKGRTRDQLYAEAQKLNIDGRSKMNKSQLQHAVDARK
jgi:bacterioferritin